MAIDPGTRAIGYAEFAGTDLVDYGVRIIRRSPGVKGTLDAVEALIQRLVREKRPQLMVIEKNNFSASLQNTRLVMAVYRMKSVARRARIPVQEIAASTARKVVCGNGYATKRDVAKVLRSRYPELSIYIDPLNRQRQQLFLNLFDAVACGLAFVKRTAQHDR
jgi:Holliday junction resolvasome RuvABC endonuclease subunit